MASKKTRLAIAVLVVASFLAVAGNALAAYHPVLPGGLNQHNPVVALAQFNSRAAVDSSLGARLASNTGESTFNVSHYQAIGYGNASKNSTNTAVDDNGNSVPATDTNHCKVGAKVLIVLNVVTQNEAEICTGCANPRIARIITNLPKKPWTVSTVVRFHREMHKRFVKICPSGQKVFGKLDVLVSGLGYDPGQDACHDQGPSPGEDPGYGQDQVRQGSEACRAEAEAEAEAGPDADRGAVQRQRGNDHQQPRYADHHLPELLGLVRKHRPGPVYVVQAGQHGRVLEHEYAAGGGELQLHLTASSAACSSDAPGQVPGQHVRSSTAPEQLGAAHKSGRQR
jgi:hypothetical protein